MTAINKEKHIIYQTEKLHYCTSFSVVYKRNTYTGQQTISKDTGYYLIFLQCLSQDICKEKLIKYSTSHLKITYCDDVHTEWGWNSVDFSSVHYCYLTK